LLCFDGNFKHFVLLFKLVVSQLVKNSSRFIESEDLLLFNSELVES